MTARLIIMGPQGSGKGTQAARLAVRLGVPTISTGDIFRANIKGGTELGVRAKVFTDAGNLVPDEITNAMVADRLAEPDAAAGFILDGYPRTADQADVLDGVLAGAGSALDAVLELDAPREELLQRLHKRAEIENRADDTEDAIRRRLEIYAEQTAPLTTRYAERGLLVVADAIGEVDEVTERLLAALAAHVG
ncbi:adenylate kinase [Pengzhenrongella frigida]|uniref:Adenylate kinase n=1 Tax=Pengzhenrongella frigida TaxID=1259133 RepID=A0A4Q5MYX7_9MICO|nr:adenylate kinase [Cellulomonas sp. HLT2-17]RYV51032.1 adenylate kinase [Cellulomonas sp. HLT2-17]